MPPQKHPALSDEGNVKDINSIILHVFTEAYPIEFNGISFQLFMELWPKCIQMHDIMSLHSLKNNRHSLSMDNNFSVTFVHLS